MALNERELRRYVQRVSDRWPLERAIIDGSASMASRCRSQDPGQDGSFVAVFVSQAFDGVPWLERVRQAAALWDADEMGGAVDVHCYTPVELERKREQLAVVAGALERGLDLLSPA